jgi:hypothetical protein
MVSQINSLLITVVDDTRNFGSALWTAIQPNVAAWATGDGSFVVVALTETFQKGEDYIYEALRLQYRLLKEKAPTNKGTKLLLEKMLNTFTIEDLEDPFTSGRAYQLPEDTDTVAKAGAKAGAKGDAKGDAKAGAEVGAEVGTEVGAEAGAEAGAE